MESAWLVILALLFGLAVGIGFTLLFVAALRRGAQAIDAAGEELPDGMQSMLDALEATGVVLGPSNMVIGASAGALSLGLIEDRRLVHAPLTAVVDRARSVGESVQEEVLLARGPFGNSNLSVIARASLLGSRYVLLQVDDRTEGVRLDEMRRDFVANISHELKTPIGAVGLLAEALSSAADEPELVRRFADRLTTEADRLTRITREIIELSRLQSADPLTDAELVDVDHIVASAIDQNAVAAEAGGVRLVRGGDKRSTVIGDEALLIVALHNLIANAIQYSSRGARIGIGVRAGDELVEIAVTDQGIGIAAEDLERVFERFYRVDQARSRNTGGTGLGLSIVKHVVQNHGGEVAVWSQRGRGSTFTVRLPRGLRPSSAEPALLDPVVFDTASLDRISVSATAPSASSAVHPGSTAVPTAADASTAQLTRGHAAGTENP
ncbi:sensor histidine kinase [Naasia lichenicola]|uniref:Sensor-like histidine kinase SenX3 n=1 Tax=Naasia lichenicola TaxID=2565933 RepID=A0A4S4FHQ0_9MICO|nr:ATP-binding protein [Naasia lichenicola]THG29819.1 two-component sensor histidine kinase [Naasia lichenicola]